MPFSKIGQVLGFGSVVFYVDPHTRDVVYAVDGEDNRKFYSYAAVKEGVIGHPVHLNSFDLWFTHHYPFPQIKGFANLKEESEDSFELIENQIEKNAEKHFNKSILGCIDSESKILNIDAHDASLEDIKFLSSFFQKLGVVNNNTLVQVNGEFIDTVDDLCNKKPISEKEEVLDLIDKYKRGMRSEAGSKLFDQYERLIISIVNKYCAAYKISSDFKEDLLQESYLKFLNQINHYDPNKSKFSTFIANTIEGLVKNAIRRQNLSEIVSTDMNQFKGVKISAINKFIDKDFLTCVLHTLPDSMCTAIKMYYLDDCTMEKVGEHLGFSKQRAEQIIKKGLRLLKTNPEIKNFYREAVKVNLIFSPKK